MNRLPEVRHWLRWLWAGALRATGGLWLAKRSLKAQGATVVLTLHRVLRDDDVCRTNSLSGMILRRRTFKLLAAYAVQRFEVVDVAKADHLHKPARARCAFTFDDGWADTYSVVWPIARTHGIPLAVFVCPALVGRSAPFWPERVAAGMRAGRADVEEPEIEAFIEHLKSCPGEAREQAVAALTATDGELPDEAGPDATLTWRQISEMDAGGVAFGAHTQTHALLTTMPKETACREIVESKDAIERALHRPCTLFAYPNGDDSVEIRSLVAAAGFRLAFTTARGPWTSNSDPFALPRTNLSESDVVTPKGRFSPALFEYSVFWKTWRATSGNGGRP